MAAHGHTHHVTPIATSDIHGPEQQTIATDLGELGLSIYETGVPPRFRLTGVAANAITVETLRAGRKRQIFLFANHGTYWESVEDIPEPHEFDVAVTLEHGGEAHVFETRFAEHDHVHGGHTHYHGPARDPLYARLRGDTTLLTRQVHIHRHGRSAPHTHWHDHFPETAHSVAMSTKTEAPLHEHRHKTPGRTALLLILGSSPMVEGIPAFFAASKWRVSIASP